MRDPEDWGSGPHSEPATTRLGVFWQRRSPRMQTALMLLPVLILAAVLRLPGLATDPPGFRQDEATVALAAQQIERDAFPIYFTDDTDALEPLFPYVVNLTSQLAGWGVVGPRLAAALLGILAAITCSLWYRQMLGLGWGLAGGLLVATSFWQLMFSRQAVPAIAMAAVGAFGLWALSKAIAHRRLLAAPSGWYGVAGIAFGLGIYTDVAMRATIPAVILIGLFLLYKRHSAITAVDRRGLLLGMVVMLLVAAPLLSYFWENPDTFRLGIASGTDIWNRVTTTLSTLVWSGEDTRAQNIPGRPLLGPILIAWGVVGLALAVRRPGRAIHGVALIWFFGMLVSVMIVAPGDHGQLLALTPALFLFPLLGMRAALQQARARSAHWARITAALIVLSVAASATWSIYSYFWSWSPAPETYTAMRGDVREAVEQIAALPPDDIPVYFSTGSHGRIVRYLAPGRTRRDFDDPRNLPLPAEGSAYLIAPASADLDKLLATYLGPESLVTAGTGPDGDPAYRMWFIDDRVRNRLPYAVPAISFEGGYQLVGFEVTPQETSAAGLWVNVVLALQVPAGSDPAWALARFDLPGADPANDYGHPVQPAPGYVAQGHELILVRITMPFPESPEMVADLQAALQTLDRAYLAPSGPNVQVIDGTHALLNAIGYIGPAP